MGSERRFLVWPEGQRRLISTEPFFECTRIVAANKRPSFLPRGYGSGGVVSLKTSQESTEPSSARDRYGPEDRGDAKQDKGVCQSHRPHSETDCRHSE